MMNFFISNKKKAKKYSPRGSLCAFFEILSTSLNIISL
jgi:hypothetical protein